MERIHFFGEVGIAGLYTSLVGVRLGGLWRADVSVEPIHFFGEIGIAGLVGLRHVGVSLGAIHFFGERESGGAHAGTFVMSDEILSILSGLIKV